MSQELTIIVLVDVQAALDANTLEGNIYLIDNLKDEGSTGEGTGELISAINGSHWCDGTQTCDIVINWLISGIGAIPLTLPRNYIEYRSKGIDDNWLRNIKKFHKSTDSEHQKSLLKKVDITGIVENIGNTNQLKDKHGHYRDLKVKTLNVFAEPFDNKHHITNLSYLPPQITNITGQAVENKVLYPAQYGTPVQIKNGWYWSATVDTSKTGIHKYTLHLILYKYNGEEESWSPVEMQYDSMIRVTNAPQVNGFTNAAVGLLPII